MIIGIPLLSTVLIWKELDMRKKGYEMKKENSYLLYLTHDSYLERRHEKKNVLNVFITSYSHLKTTNLAPLE